MQYQVPPLSYLNKRLIIVHVGLFLASSFLNMAQISLGNYLALHPRLVLQGHIYEIFTFPFISTSFMGVLFNSLILWFIGSELELKWGSYFYGKLLFLSTLFSGLVYFLLSLISASLFEGLPLQGLGGMVFTLLLAYGIIFSERILVFMFIFPMKAKYFVMLLGGIELYMGIFSPHGRASWAHLTAAFVGFIVLKLQSLKARGVSLASIKKEQRKKKMRSRIKLVEDEDFSQKKADPKDPKFWQ